MAEPDFWTRLWEIVCDREDLVRLGFAIPLAFLVLQLLTAPAIEPGTDSYVIMVVNLAILVPYTIAMLYVVVRCKRREPVERF